MHAHILAICVYAYTYINRDRELTTRINTQICRTKQINLQMPSYLFVCMLYAYINLFIHFLEQPYIDAADRGLCQQWARTCWPWLRGLSSLWGLDVGPWRPLESHAIFQAPNLPLNSSINDRSKGKGGCMCQPPKKGLCQTYFLDEE